MEAMNPLSRLKAVGARAEPLSEAAVLADLLTRSGRGDQAAFGQLYDRVAGLVHGIVLKVVRDPSQAEEITQEVFVEIWRLAPRYEQQRGSVKSWIATPASPNAIRPRNATMPTRAA